MASVPAGWSCASRPPGGSWRERRLTRSDAGMAPRDDDQQAEQTHKKQRQQRCPQCCSPLRLDRQPPSGFPHQSTAFSGAAHRRSCLRPSASGPAPACDVGESEGSRRRPRSLVTRFLRDRRATRASVWARVAGGPSAGGFRPAMCRCRLVIVGVGQSKEPPEATADTSPPVQGMPQGQDLRTRRARPRGPRPAGTARWGPTRPSSRCRPSPPAPQELTLRFGHIHRCRDRERRGTPQATGRAAVSIHLSLACSSFLTRCGFRSQRNTRQARRPCLLRPARLDDFRWSVSAVV